MNEPITIEETCRVLETAELFWLSTGRADGRPHATLVVAVWTRLVLPTGF